MMTRLRKYQKTKYFRLLWCLLVVWIFWQFAAAMTRSTFLPRRIEKSLGHYKESMEESKQMLAKAEHKQPPKSMFTFPKKAQMPKCSAVLGDEALINDKWYKVGSTASGAKILAINPESVTILWEEKERILIPFDVPVQRDERSSSSAPGPRGTPEVEQPVRPANSERPDRRNVENGGPRGPGMLSPDESRQMYERYQNASPEEREKMRQEMRERYGGRGRGPREER